MHDGTCSKLTQTDSVIIELKSVIGAMTKVPDDARDYSSCIPVTSNVFVYRRSRMSEK